MKILFLHNHLAAWLPPPPGPPGELLARIQAGEWQPPPGLLRRFALPPGVGFSACLAGGMVVVRPAWPPGGSPPAPLTADQARVRRLMGQGLAERQIARALGRSPRWVRYQVAAIKRRRNRGT